MSIEGAEAIRSEPWLEKLEFSFEVGEVLPRVESHGQRLCVFVVSGPDRETVERRIAQVYAGIRFRIAAGDERPEKTRWKAVSSTPGERIADTPDRRRAANSRRLLAAAAQAVRRN